MRAVQACSLFRTSRLTPLRLSHVLCVGGRSRAHRKCIVSLVCKHGKQDEDQGRPAVRPRSLRSCKLVSDGPLGEKPYLVQDYKHETWP